MKNWTVIAAFTYSHQAHLAKSKLESEEIEVLVRDELNAQVCEAGSNAIGGVKLCVRETKLRYIYPSRQAQQVLFFKNQFL